MQEFYIEDIKKEIQNSNYDKVSELFIKLIHDLNQENHPKLGEVCYEYGMFLFELYEYELSVTMLKKAYELEFERGAIKNFLYECFIKPNKDEFEINYKSALIEKRNCIYLESIPSIEELSLDFIPLSENRFMIFNNQREMFEDVIDISHNESKKAEKIRYEDEFFDLVLVDNGTMKDIWKYSGDENGRTIYYITQGSDRILSFMKLSQMVEKYFQPVYIFESLAQLEQFLYHNTAVYIPRIIDTKDGIMEKAFYDMIERVHMKRINSFEDDNKNILLSICIPTFNRGHRALQCVKHLIKLPFDSEIEIVISNNGSTEYIKEYAELREIKDSRINYFEYKENQGFTKNLYNVITMAKGKYSLIMSDEDILLPLGLKYYLKSLSNMEGMAFGSASTVRTYNYEEGEGIWEGEAYLDTSFAHSNISGLIYNNQLFHGNKTMNQIVENIDNQAAVYYPHLCWNLMLYSQGSYHQWGKILIQEGKDEKTLAVEKDGTLPHSESRLPYYTTMESRLAQHDGFLYIINSINFLNDSHKVLCYYYLCIRIFFLTYALYKNNIKLEFTRQEAETIIYAHCIDRISRLNVNSDMEEASCLLINELKKKYEKDNL